MPKISNRDMIENLVQLATSLIETDRNVVKAVVNSDFESLPSLISDFRNTKIVIQKCLSQLGVVEGVDDKAKEALIRVQKPFPTDNVISQIERKSGEDVSFRDLSDEEICEIGSDLLYSWISHYEYVRNIFRVNTLVFRSSIAPGLRHYILEARNCFALEQHNAVISMCRTILEAAAKDICEKLDLFKPSPENVIEINPKVFNHLIKSISKGELKKRTVRLYYRDACPVVHGDSSVTTDEAFRVLCETMDVIQELYSSHRL
jgi:hypothetical protein